MNAINLKEKLGNNVCHIHQQLPAITISEDGNMEMKTCCILFKSQLHLLADEQHKKQIDS